MQQPESHISHPKYRADIDGLRAFAVLSVVFYHAFPKGAIGGGFIGVDVFFVISGFLITSIIIGNLKNRSFSYTEFYKRRVRRIFPALTIVLLFCVIFGWFSLLSSEYKSLGKHTLGGIGFVSNLILLGETSYFNTTADATPLLHLWSLAIEEQFYIIWPLWLGLIWRRQWNFITLTSLAILASFCINILSFPAHADAGFYSPLSRFWELMAGGLLAYVTPHSATVNKKIHDAKSVAGLGLLILGLFLIEKTRAFPSWWALLPTTGTVLLISAGPEALCNRKVLSSKVAVWFGKISYPLYLWHWPLLSLAFILNNYEPLTRSCKNSIIALSIALAYATYKLVETPVRAHLKVPTSRLLGAFSLVGMLAASVLIFDGLPNRAVHKNEARVFVDRYVKLHKFGLAEAYQERCDFYDWATGGNKGVIDIACTTTNGINPTYLLWGDSHAQALSFGFRKNLASGVQLAHIATSGCQPKISRDPKNGANKAACQASNDLAMKFIQEHRPARVFVAQGESHELTDWFKVADFVRANKGELILIGPVPQWRPSLPIVVARHLNVQYDYVGEGLDARIATTNSKLKTTYPQGGGVTYVSIMDALCRTNECLAKVPSSDPFDLLVVDYGHLSPAGSDFVARTVFKSLLRPPAATQTAPPGRSDLAHGER